MPGFRSTPGDVPSHSMEANAEVVAALVEHYGIRQYHVIGQGYGGVAAMELASAHPGRVRSLTLLSSPGAQEFELLGNPLVNKSTASKARASGSSRASRRASAPSTCCPSTGTTPRPSSTPT